MSSIVTDLTGVENVQHTGVGSGYHLIATLQSVKYCSMSVSAGGNRAERGCVGVGGAEAG